MPKNTFDATDTIADFNQLFDLTCRIISTFKGPAGKESVGKINALLKTNPDLQQFLYELYYNTRTAAISTVDKEKAHD